MPDIPKASNLESDLWRRVDRCLTDRQYIHRARERRWTENLLFGAGRHWTFLDRQSQTWQEKALRSFVPKPVTNKVQETACLDAETRIPCLDGTYPTIADLAGRNVPVWLYGFDQVSLRIVPTLAERVWQTGRKPCVRVVFEEGTSIVCTPDHRFLTWGRGSVEAQHLRHGESIVPFLEARPLGRYARVVQPWSGTHERVHHLVALGRDGFLPGGPRRHVHHLNGNTRDNRPENLSVLSASGHMAFTIAQRYARGELLGTKNPNHPIRLKKLWQDPAYREKQRIARRAALARRSPERLEALRCQAKRLTLDPDIRAKHRAGIDRYWDRKRQGTTGGPASNHRVSAVLPVGDRDVFDIACPATENFATQAGVFVHNSTIIAILLRTMPTFTAVPFDETPDDIATADVAGAALEVLREETRLEVARQELARSVTYCGTGFLLNGVDNDPTHGITEIPYQVCDACNRPSLPKSIVEANDQCPHCGGQAFHESEAKAQFPKGQFFTQSLSPFEVFPGTLFQPEVLDQRLITVRRRIDVESAKERYPEQEGRIQADAPPDQGILYQEALAYLAGTEADHNLFGGAGATTGANELITEHLLFQLPSRTGDLPLPEGAQAVFYGRILVEAKGLGSRDDEGRAFLPIVRFVFDPVTGGFFGRTVIEDIVAKNRQRNEIESAVQLAFRRTANPVWLYPEGVGITKLTGAPGQIVRYNALNSAKAKPERIPGMPPPPAMIQFMRQIDNEIEELASTLDALKGQRPPGVSAGYAIRMLIERGMSRFAPLFLSLETGFRTWAQQQMALFRAHGGAQRIYRTGGQHSRWEMRKFSNADLKGQIIITVEAGSAAPRSRTIEQVEIDQLMQRGVVDVNQPAIARKILAVYGQPKLNPNLSSAEESVFREQDRFRKTQPTDILLAQLAQLGQEAQALNAQAEQIATLAPGDPAGARQAAVLAAQAQAKLEEMEALFGLHFRETDDHRVSAEYHRQMARTEWYEERPRPVQKLLELHIRRHEEAMLKKAAEMQQMMAPAVSAAKAGAPLGGPKPALRRPAQYRPQGVATRQIGAQARQGEERAAGGMMGPEAV